MCQFPITPIFSQTLTWLHAEDYTLISTHRIKMLSRLCGDDRLRNVEMITIQGYEYPFVLNDSSLVAIAQNSKIVILSHCMSVTDSGIERLDMCCILRFSNCLQITKNSICKLAYNSSGQLLLVPEYDNHLIEWVAVQHKHGMLHGSFGSPHTSRSLKS